MSTENYSTKTKLADILENGTGEKLAKQWDATEAATDFAPLPGGNYVAHVNKLELFSAKTGTPGVKMQFKVAEGDYAGRYVFHDLWLTASALPQTKRDCAKLGLTTLDKLESAMIPPGRIRCKVRVALRTDDDGEQRNRVRRFDVLGIDEPERDPFAPSANATAPEPTDATTVAGGDSRFDFDAAASETKAPTDTAAAAGGNGSADGNGAVAAAPGATQEPDAVEGGDDATPF